MAKLDIDKILGNIGNKYEVTDHVDGMQHDPNSMVTTDFKQEYTVVIRKKEYYAVSALEGENAYIRVYQLNDFSSISTSISTTGSIGSCSISLVGNTRITCADRADQDSAKWSSFSSLLNEWSYNIDDNETMMGSYGNYIYSDVLYDNIDDMKKMKYGWRVAEKCDFEPMDEIYIYAKSRRQKENGKYKVYQIFFGYISDVTKSYTAGKSNPIISIKAQDHLKLLQYSYITTTFAADYRYAVAAAHYDKDFAGNIIIDDNPFPGSGAELKYNPYTNVFAGAYPYEIITKCAQDAGIPDKFLKKRIEKVKRIPFMPQPRSGKPIELFQSTIDSRLGFCQQAAEKLFLEFFADEEGNIVLKIPNYTLGINRESANNAYLDTYISNGDKELMKKTGKHEVVTEKEVTTYETVIETLSQSITHTVGRGDTLWDISQKYLGDSSRWPEIYTLNKDKIKDPHWIYPGQVINIKKGVTNTRQVEKKTKVQTKEVVDGGTLSSVTDKYIPTIYDSEIISFVVTDSDNQIVNSYEIHQEVPLVQASLDSVPQAVKRVVQDWGSIIRFGMRPAKVVSTPLLDKEIGPVLFGTLMVQRSLSQRYLGTLTMIEESSIRVGDPIRLFMYDEHPYKYQSAQLVNGKAQSIFYVERIERSIKPDGVSTMTLSLSTGRVMGMESIYDKLSALYSRYYDEYSPVEFNLNSFGLSDTSSDSSNSGVSGGSVAGATQKQSKIVTYAKNFLGVPYLWGGKTPSGFDCSGFVSYVFKCVDVNIPSYTFTMKDYGTSVSLSALQPGDMIFFNGYNHVGIYIGNNQVIHARGSETEQGGQFKVQINALEGWYKTSLCDAKRLV